MSTPFPSSWFDADAQAAPEVEDVVYLRAIADDLAAVKKYVARIAAAS